MTAAGVLTFVGSLALAGCFIGIERALGEPGGNDSPAQTMRSLSPLWISAGAGAGLGIAGGFWLRRRIQQRRPYIERIRALQAASVR